MQPKDRNRFISQIQDHHEGQFDTLKAPYWLHPYRVALEAEGVVLSVQQKMLHPFLEENPDAADRAFIIGLYHDVIEDVPGSLPLVAKELEYDHAMLRSLMLLCKPSEWPSDVDKFLTEEEMTRFRLAETYVEKIMVLISIGDIFSIIVKLCDNADNSLFWRAKVPGRPNLKYSESKVLLEKAFTEKFAS